MNVIPIRSKMLFKDFGPRTDSASEGARFFAKAALNFWGPTLLFCYLIGAPLPIYVMLCSHSVGVLWGLLIYRRHYYGAAACVPVDYRPDVPKAQGIDGVDKAA